MNSLSCIKDLKKSGFGAINYFEKVNGHILFVKNIHKKVAKLHTNFKSGFELHVLAGSGNALWERRKPQVAWDL